MPRPLSIFLLVALLCPSLSYAQGVPLAGVDQEIPPAQSSPLIPVFFFLHHRLERPLGVLAVAPIGSALDEYGGYFERWLVVYAPVPYSSFTENTIPATAHCGSLDIQCISYAYDANGNITKIVENASTSAIRTVDYTYDDLNRLITASSSNVSSTANYSYTYAYNAIGNLLSGNAGTYSYSTSTYANPHAPTTIASSSLTYDANGNLTAYSTSTFAWNYRNELTSSNNGSANSTYLYDHLGQRVKLTEGSTSTLFASKEYNITGSSTLKHVFANNQLVATVQSGTTYYDLVDHLGGLNLVTDTSGNLMQTLDYYPYGSTRVNINSGSDERRKFIGQEYDNTPQLYYLNARYYDPTRGQFISEDPSHLALGDINQLKVRTGQNLQTYLTNPQQLNSYSYALNNPIVKKDPSGNTVTETQLLEAQVNVLKGIVYLYQSGHGNEANEVFSAYQTAFGGSGSNAVPTPLHGPNRVSPPIMDITRSLSTEMRVHADDPRLFSPFYFRNKVKDEGDWNLKETPAYNGKIFKNGFVFNDEHMRFDAPGNLHYGYVGAGPWWSTASLLLGQAGAAQSRSEPQWQNSYFYGDDPVDQVNILWGMSLYLNR